jgi:hypothetical protein
VVLGPCEECGFDPGRVADGELAGEIRRLGSRYRAPLTRLLPGEDGGVLRERPQPTVWSAIEYAAHVRDVFDLFDARVALVLTGDRPVFEVVDHDQAVVAGGYRDLDAVVVAAQTTVSAEALAARLEGLGPSDWDRWGTREGETRTVREIAQRAVHEAHHHLLDIGRALRGVRQR